MTDSPPGPRGFLPGRALLSFPRHPEAFRRLTRRYGDMVSFRVGSQQFFLINHPDQVREAFVTKHDRFVKGWGPVGGKTVLGFGLVTAERPLHQRQRRIVLPAMHRQRLEEYAAAVVREGRAMCRRWEGRREVDVLAEARHTTTRVIGETLFEVDLGDDLPRINHAIAVFFGRFSGRMHAFAGALRRLRFRWAAKGAASARDLRDYADRLIAARRERPGRDLVSMLLEARDEDGQPLSSDQIRDETVTFIVAGHETVTIALAWAWKLLAENQGAQEKLHAELEAVLGGREPAFEDLRRLPYTQGVIAEALRLFPPQWMIGRRAVEDVQIGATAIPRGAIVLLSLFAMQRDARWFDDPEAFRPERWSAGVEKSATPYTYLPFGLALRRCVGEGFAWMESTLLLAQLASTFRVLPSTSGQKSAPRVLLWPKHANLRFEARA